MGIRQKFFLLSGIVGFIMAIVSYMGYYNAQKSLEVSIHQEMRSELDNQVSQVEGWLGGKIKTVSAAATLMHNFEDGTLTPDNVRKTLGLIGDDKEILEILVGNEEGLSVGYRAGNMQGKLDPRQRPWYQSAKKTNKIYFTDVYKDAITGNPVVSIAVPYNDGAGQFRGAVVQGLTLGSLATRAQEFKYHGVGDGMIVDAKGTILASAEKELVMSSLDKNELLKDHAATILGQAEGYISIKKGDEARVFIYKTVPTTKWIIGISVPEKAIFSQLQSLKLIYGVLTVLGILLVIISCLRFSMLLTRSINRLEKHANNLASGDLSMEDLKVESRDEIGHLIQSFNSMKKNLRLLITRMKTTAEQVAASSEELTASSQQSAYAVTHVTKAVDSVVHGMDEQMRSIDTASQNVKDVARDIERASDRTAQIVSVSVKAADAAQQGEKLMTAAIANMVHIETSVNDSAKVVGLLGENSKEIGQIVDTISSIADQTNLLALNAAIEAARAGEHGRGFSVVAEEVRKLAEQSRVATEEIKNRIEKIQTDTQQAVHSMESGSMEVKNGTQSIQEVGSQFKEIQQMVNVIRDQLEEMSHIVEGVASGGKKIAGAVEDIEGVSSKAVGHTKTISSAAGEQAQSSKEIAAASQALSEMAGELQNAVMQFKL